MKIHIYMDFVIPDKCNVSVNSYKEPVFKRWIPVFNNSFQENYKGNPNNYCVQQFKRNF